jgi:hypothetical protein
MISTHSRFIAPADRHWRNNRTHEKNGIRPAEMATPQDTIPKKSAMKTQNGIPFNPVFPDEIAQESVSRSMADHRW